MASTDATINTIQHIENNLPATQDSVLEAGTVNDNAPVANTADNAAVDSAPLEPADFDLPCELRTLADGSVYVVNVEPKKRKTEQPAAATPVKKRKKPTAAAAPPPAPQKPAPAPRVVTAASPVVTRILAALAPYPEESIPELREILEDLRGARASFSLQRLLASYVSDLVNSKDKEDFVLHKLLFVCFGYATAGEENRVILRETIKLPNFISKDSTVVLKHCKSLLGVNYPAEQQARVIGILRGLWHVFSSVHLLPTVWWAESWIYQTVDDCINKAVRFSFDLPRDCWYLIDMVLFCSPADRARLRQVCRAAYTGCSRLRFPKPCTTRGLSKLTEWTAGFHSSSDVYLWGRPAWTNIVCAHCLGRYSREDSVLRNRPRPNFFLRKSGTHYFYAQQTFYECWKCALMAPYQDRLTVSAWKDGALIIRLERTELEPELREDGLAHSVQSYEDAICSEKPTPRGYKIEVGFSAFDIDRLRVGNEELFNSFVSGRPQLS